MKGKTPPVQVAEGEGSRHQHQLACSGDHYECKYSVSAIVERHKLEQDAATGMQLALGQNTVHIVPYVYR